MILNTIGLYNIVFRIILTCCLIFDLHLSDSVSSYSRHLELKHDTILETLFDEGTYKKIYSYKHLINGFAVDVSPEQVKTLTFLF